MRQLIRIVFVIAVVGASVWLLQANGAPQVGAPAATARATSAPTTARAASSAPTTAGRTAVASPTPAAFVLTLSDADLTKSAASAFPQTVSGVTVSDPQVSVETGGVRLTATAKVLFGTTQFVMTATPLVADGRITVRVDTATLAGIGLPDSTRASIADTVQSTIAKLIPADVIVTSVALAPGRLAIQGTQPR